MLLKLLKAKWTIIKCTIPVDWSGLLFKNQIIFKNKLRTMLYISSKYIIQDCNVGHTDKKQTLSFLNFVFTLKYLHIVFNLR